MQPPRAVNRHSADEHPIRPPSSSIFKELAEKCEVVHITKSFSRDRRASSLGFGRPLQNALTRHGHSGPDGTDNDRQECRPAHAVECAYGHSTLGSSIITAAKRRASAQGAGLPLATRVPKTDLGEDDETMVGVVRPLHDDTTVMEAIGLGPSATPSTVAQSASLERERSCGPACRTSVRMLDQALVTAPQRYEDAHA